MKIESFKELETEFVQSNSKSLVTTAVVFSNLMSLVLHQHSSKTRTWTEFCQEARQNHYELYEQVLIIKSTADKHVNQLHELNFVQLQNILN